MEEIIKYVLNRFGISKDDLRPSLNPKPTNHKARIILAKFLKDKDFVNTQIQEVLFTNDVSVIYYLIRRFNEKKYPELDDLLCELEEKFKEIKGDGFTVKSRKCCIKCKQSKLNYLHFRKVKKGKYYHLCLLCEEENSLKVEKRKMKKLEVKQPKVIVLKPPKLPKPTKQIKPKVVKVKVEKPKVIKPNIVKPLKKTVNKKKYHTIKPQFGKIKRKRNPKLKIDESNINSLFPFASISNELIKIAQSKKENDNREQELFKQGKRFVKSTKHIRAYVLPKN